MNQEKVDELLEKPFDELTEQDWDEIVNFFEQQTEAA